MMTEDPASYFEHIPLEEMEQKFALSMEEAAHEASCFFEYLGETFGAQPHDMLVIAAHLILTTVSFAPSAQEATKAIDALADLCKTAVVNSVHDYPNQTH